MATALGVLITAVLLLGLRCWFDRLLINSLSRALENSEETRSQTHQKYFDMLEKYDNLKAKCYDLEDRLDEHPSKEEIEQTYKSLGVSP